jgi:hypothetical protein
MAKKTKKRVRRYPKHPTGRCEVEGCNRKHRSRGMCGMHLQRWNREGKPGEAMPRPGFGTHFPKRRESTRLATLAKFAANGGRFNVVYPSQRRARAKVGLRAVSISVPSLNAFESLRWIRVVGREGAATVFTVTDRGMAALREAAAK